MKVNLSRRRTGWLFLCAPHSSRCLPPVLCNGKQQTRMWTHSWYWIFDNRMVQRGVHTSSNSYVTSNHGEGDGLGKGWTWCLEATLLLVFTFPLTTYWERFPWLQAGSAHILWSPIRLITFAPHKNLFKQTFYLLIGCVLPVKSFLWMMVVWTGNSCCVSEMLGLWGFFCFFFFERSIFRAPGD